jgi:hypothetical protein
MRNHVLGHPLLSPRRRHQQPELRRRQHQHVKKVGTLGVICADAVPKTASSSAAPIKRVTPRQFTRDEFSIVLTSFQRLHYCAP